MRRSSLGWKFEGDDAVYTDAQLDNLVYAADESVTEVNLYAQWEQVPEDARYVTVHFYDEFGTYLGDGSVLNGTSDWSGPIDAPELDPGYTFLGWAEEGGSVYSPELLGQVVVSVPDDVTELTYIAHYEKTPVTQTHKVTFDDCLESTKNQVVEVADGETVAVRWIGVRGLDVPGLVYGYPAHAGVRLLHSGHCRHDALRQVAAECRATGRGHHG